MVELSKKILIKVSFDRYLFHKELIKALKYIDQSEDLILFREWCIIKFGQKYPQILEKVFNKNKVG